MLKSTLLRAFSAASDARRVNNAAIPLNINPHTLARFPQLRIKKSGTLEVKVGSASALPRLHGKGPTEAGPFVYFFNAAKMKAITSVSSGFLGF